LTVRHDALDNDLVRDIENLGKRKRKRERVVNGKTIGKVLGIFDVSRGRDAGRSHRMVDVLSGSAAGWANSIVDFEERTVTVHGTVIRVTGRRLFVQAHTKTIAGMRTIRPPDWVMAIQKRRHAERACGWMSPSSTDTIPDPTTPGKPSARSSRARRSRGWTPRLLALRR
jgi:hypothetical protein